MTDLPTAYLFAQISAMLSCCGGGVVWILGVGQRLSRKRTATTTARGATNGKQASATFNLVFELYIILYSEGLLQECILSERPVGGSSPHLECSKSVEQSIYPKNLRSWLEGLGIWEQAAHIQVYLYNGTDLTSPKCLIYSRIAYRIRLD
jgi:hypothetical protein